MTGWNLPPGCNTGDIPGNRPIDVAWDEWWVTDEWVAVCLDCDRHEDCFWVRDGRESDCLNAIDAAFEVWYSGLGQEEWEGD